MTYIKKITLFFSLFIISFTAFAKASLSETVDEYSNYNIITAKRWYIAPYAFAGYAFEYVPFNSKEGLAHYSKMIRSDHHGYILGAGISINQNWIFGVSFQQTMTTNKVSAEYSDILDEIASEVMMTNIDVAVKTPFTLLNNNLEFLILGGANIIVANIANSYKKDVTTVPIELAKKTAQAAFGVNLGLSVRYNFLKYLYIGIEARRLFILTSKSSLTKDTWMISGVLGINF